MESKEDTTNTIMLRYWTISGRNLVTTTSTSREAMHEQMNYEDKDENDSVASLLMDVNRIYDENEEASSSSVSSSIGEEANGAFSAEGQVVTEGIESSIVNEAVGTADTDGTELNSMTEDGNASEDEGDNIDTIHSSSSSTSSTTTTTTTPTTSLYQPIRLRAILTDDDSSGSKYLTPSQRQILMEEIINPALFAWSQALHVVPVGSGGGADGGDTTTNHQNLVVDQSQLYDSVSCGPGLDSGLPSVIVPEEHMTVGLADTDTVIYIHIAFADNMSLKTNGTMSLGSDNQYYLHRSTTGDTTTRIEDGDETTFISMLNETTSHPSSFPSYAPSFAPSETEPNDVATRPTCPGTYLASATYCSTDQYDRPIAGILSLCIPSTNIHYFFHDQGQMKRNIVTVMHEIGHVLGFNAQSLANIRDPDTGEPLTPRDANGNVPMTNDVECTGVAPRANADIPLPSTNIVKFRSVRGGVRVATIVTPTVQRVARNMFGCRTLVGAELESWEGQLFQFDDNPASLSNNAEQLTPGECIGDHWSRRSFRSDLMNTIVDDVPHSLFISSLTLAYFADTGWYRINADRIAPPSMWGRNAGCDFVEMKCLSSSGHVTAKNIAFFCDNFADEPSEEESMLEDEEEDNDETDGEDKTNGDEEDEEVDKYEDSMEIHGCSLDSSRKAVCSLVEYDSAIPTEFNYFGKDKQLDHTYYYGGSDPTLDYCPVFEGYANGRCDDEKSQELMEVRSSLEVFGEANSRCVMGNVERKRTALCLPIACVIQEQSLMIKVDGYWKHCSYAGQIISVWWNPNDYVVCPDPSRMCPTFYCPNDCFREGGICDYQNRQCMCAVAPLTNSSFTNYYKCQRYEPCTLGEGHVPLEASDGSSPQVVERIGFELPDYYVENVTVLLDDPRNFDDKVSRMFSQLSSGEVVGLVASFMICAIFSFILWSQFVRCYYRRRHLINKSLSKAKISVSSFSGLLSSASRATLNNGQDDDYDGGMDSPSSRHPRGGESRNSQKDKMVATLLVQMRTELTSAEDAEQRGQLTAAVSNTENIVDLSSSSTISNGIVVVNRSDLPTLPEGGRVLAVVGAHIVEDEGAATTTDDASSTTGVSSSNSITPQTIPYSEYASPLYQEDAREERNIWRRVSRLRRQLD